LQLPFSFQGVNKFPSQTKVDFAWIYFVYLREIHSPNLVLKQNGLVLNMCF